MPGGGGGGEPVGVSHGRGGAELSWRGGKGKEEGIFVQLHHYIVYTPEERKCFFNQAVSEEPPCPELLVAK